MQNADGTFTTVQIVRHKLAATEDNNWHGKFRPTKPDQWTAVKQALLVMFDIGDGRYKGCYDGMAKTLPADKDGWVNFVGLGKLSKEDPVGAMQQVGFVV